MKFREHPRYRRNRRVSVGGTSRYERLEDPFIDLLRRLHDTGLDFFQASFLCAKFGNDAVRKRPTWTMISELVDDERQRLHLRLSREQIAFDEAEYFLARLDRWWSILEPRGKLAGVERSLSRESRCVGSKVLLGPQGRPPRGLGAAWLPRESESERRRVGTPRRAGASCFRVRRDHSAPPQAARGGSRAHPRGVVLEGVARASLGDISLALLEVLRTFVEAHADKQASESRFSTSYTQRRRRVAASRLAGLTV